MSEARSEYKLKNPPDDAISTVRFAPKSSYILLVSSWDSYVRLYDVLGNAVKTKYTHNQSPVLDALMTVRVRKQSIFSQFINVKDTNKVFSGALDGTIISSDINGDQKYTVGQHEDAVRCLEYSEDRNVLATGSWDRLVKLWDERTLGPVGTHSQQDHVYTMSVKDEMLIVGTSARKIIVWDLRNMGQPFQQRDSLLKYQTRCVRIFPNKQGYVLSSIEGRVAVEYFDPNPEIQKKKYAFKCHRIKEHGMECIYPVNAISFHSEHSTFATGGSDGFVNVWDGFNKKRLCQFHRYPTGISSLAFSNCGSVLAIGCSYLGEQEEPPQPPPEDCIFIRNVTDQETKPK